MYVNGTKFKTIPSFYEPKYLFWDDNLYCTGELPLFKVFYKIAKTKKSRTNFSCNYHMCFKRKTHQNITELLVSARFSLETYKINYQNDLHSYSRSIGQLLSSVEIIFLLTHYTLISQSKQWVFCVPQSVRD